MVECRLAALCLQKYKFNKIDLQNIPKLKTVQESYGVDLPSMLNQLDFTFARDDKKAQEPFTRAEVLAKLGITEEELKTHVLSSNTQDMDEFWLYKRAEHVFSEAFRVEQFARICNGEQGENVLTKLGTVIHLSFQFRRLENSVIDFGNAESTLDFQLSKLKLVLVDYAVTLTRINDGWKSLVMLKRI